MSPGHVAARSLSVAVVSPSLPAAGRKAGGVAQVAHDLAGGLARRGHRVTVWSFDPLPEGAAYRVAPLPWKRFATSRLGRFATEGYLGNVLALLPGYGDADAIVAMGDSLLLPLLRKPVVRVMHGSALGEALAAGSPWRFVSQLGIYPQELLTALTQRGCVGVSHNTRRYNPFVRRIIPNGIDLSAFHPGSEKTPEPSVLFVGTLEGRKRGRLLLESFLAEVRPRHPSATLTLVSPSGPPAEGVVYRTGISTAELAGLYRRSWVYASPSSYEGFGLPYLEAMASGTPVVATPNPGSREVLDGGRHGLLVEDRELGPAILGLLEDGETRREWAERGLERARSYSLERMVDAYEELLLGLTSRDGGRGTIAITSPEG
ncbi:MAG TPA: glycosyltransferase family 4 protein [Longimicrobiaceae bacterium]|nr:glycosyltransferase family 4 protein [Longimicrobiaceae bacterium]